MVIKHNEGFKWGYNAICELESQMQMKVGVIQLAKNTQYLNDDQLERAILLVEGKVKFIYKDRDITVERGNCFDENPICLHLPRGMKLEMNAISDCELIYQAVDNHNDFEPVLFNKADTVSDIFGNDTLQNTSIRTVRTIIDDDIAPHSNLVIGEVINHPGKWSSYPPHHHVQPEVYYYKFLPETGFGFSLIDHQAYMIEHQSASLIHGHVVHPQCSAPGYAMYYVWMIPHTKEKRWLKDRTFDTKHTWLLDENAKIWQDKNI
jgi:5-deoxy-glucuronate isomerase